MADYEEKLSEGRVNFIPCVAWVPKGVAKSNPDRVEVSKEDLARIIAETKENVKDLEEIEEEEYEKLEEEESDASTSKAGGSGANKNKSSKKDLEEDDDKKDFMSRYNLSGYEEEEEEDKLDQLLQLGLLTMHASNEDDPYVTVKDDDDNDSEAENHEILSTDNLIAVGRVDDDAAILEVHVYNAEERSMYVHHDVLLPAVPLCMEWLNYDPGDEQLKPSNMLAIGSMSPVINVWDLDLVDSLQPAYSLGKMGKKKKKLPGVGHKQPVLSLSWNKQMEHVLASGSVDQTVILWDLQYGSVASQLECFEEKVQTLKWHHTEPHTLLTGACDGKVRIFDCRTNDNFKAWKLDGEVECTIWETNSSESHRCIASTDQGTVYGIDARQDKPLWTLKAHTDACTAIRMSPQCPGCLVTVSADKSIKVWDIMEDKPTFIEENIPYLGVIQCLDSSPDAPFIFCMGGDNKEGNLKVWDIRQSTSVRSRFCSRVGLPEDIEEEEEKVKGNEEMDVDDSSQKPESKAIVSEWKPKPKFKKKKGGHLDNRRRKF